MQEHPETAENQNNRTERIRLKSHHIMLRQPHDKWKRFRGKIPRRVHSQSWQPNCSYLGAGGLGRLNALRLEPVTKFGSASIQRCEMLT